MENTNNRFSMSLLFHEKVSKLSLKEQKLYFLAFFYWYCVTFCSFYIFLEKLFLNFKLFFLLSFRLAAFEFLFKTFRSFLFNFYFFIKLNKDLYFFFYNLHFKLISLKFFIQNSYNNLTNTKVFTFLFLAVTIYVFLLKVYDFFFSILKLNETIIFDLKKDCVLCEAKLRTLLAKPYSKNLKAKFISFK